MDEFDNKQCKFDIAWQGRCNAPTMPGSKFCEKHAEKKCGANVGTADKYKPCGKQATHECPETHQFVCGAPLCDEHKGKCECLSYEQN